MHYHHLSSSPRYEPMLLALLKRRDGTSEALVKARQQAQQLRARRGPLREEGQRLGLQRACLEERLKLMETHRREDVEQYRVWRDEGRDGIRSSRQGWNYKAVQKCFTHNKSLQHTQT